MAIVDKSKNRLSYVPNLEKYINPGLVSNVAINTNLYFIPYILINLENINKAKNAVKNDNILTCVYPTPKIFIKGNVQIV